MLEYTSQEFFQKKSLYDKFLWSLKALNNFISSLHLGNSLAGYKITDPKLFVQYSVDFYYNIFMYQCSVQFSHSVVSDSLWLHELQHVRLPCPSPTPRACSNSWPLSRWCHPTISSSAIPFSSCLQSFPASGSFPMSQFFTSGSQRIRASASVSSLPMNIQDWFP